MAEVAVIAVALLLVGVAVTLLRQRRRRPPGLGSVRLRRAREL